MADIEKIKAIIKQYGDKGERLYNESCEYKEDSQTIGYWDGYKDCANLLLRELDDMQEEPKVCMYSKDNYTDEDRKVLCDGCEEECEFNKKEEPVSEEQVKESLISKHEDKTCKENGNSLTQEPIRDDLEESIDTYLSTYFGGEKEKQEWPFLKKMAIHFANWQKEQFENNRLKHCDSITNEQAELEQGFIDQHLDKYNRMPTFLDAIEYGMEYYKQQMMAKAVGATVHIDAGGYPYIPQMELYNYEKDIPFAKEGDKYKVILIKED